MPSLTECLDILEGKVELWPWLEEARRVRERHFGLWVETCAIVNAKSGLCPSDCKFCAQSKAWTTKVKIYPLLSEEDLLTKVALAAQSGIDRFSFVTSGISLSQKELKLLIKVIEKAKNLYPQVELCASLGQLKEDALKALKEAGLSRYHHNLETAASFYPQICTKQDWKARYETAWRVKEVGLSLCCGGIFGLGETPKHVLELAEALQNLEPDSVPINFLHPIPGTPLEGAHFLTPMQCLRILTVFRLLLPQVAIRVCGGREYNLRDLQALALLPANALMVGHYLTTRGRELAHDYQMILDLGYQSHLRPD